MKKMKFRLLFAMLICIAMLFAVGIVTSAEEGGKCTSTLDCGGTYEGGVCNVCGGSDEVVVSVTVGEESKDYADFHVAFRDAAAAGTATVTLKSDISKEDSIGFSLGDPFDITLDLAGYYMDTYYFDLYYGQTLSIVDSSENMLGVFEGAHGLTSINLRGGTFKFFSGTINTTLMFVPDWSEEKNKA